MTQIIYNTQHNAKRQPPEAADRLHLPLPHI